MDNKFKGLYDTSKTTYITNTTKEIKSKEELYDNCENMEELYDKHYVPLLEELYHSKEKFRIRSRSYNHILLENAQLTEEKEELKQALIDIREYINRTRKEYNKQFNTEIDWLYIKDESVLQIIDKVLGGSDE